eukprot:8091150-Alexandrium_andersonii.AAC.1
MLSAEWALQAGQAERGRWEDGRKAPGQTIDEQRGEQGDNETCFPNAYRKDAALLQNPGN